MFRLDTLTELVTTPGPYATAYLDATRSKELGPQEVAARWRALRDSLAEQGVDTATLDAMEAVAGRHTVLPAPPRRKIARWAALPHLMPMVAQLGPVVPYVLAVVDRTGADVTVHGPRGTESETVQGDDTEVHKVKVGGWAQDRY